MNKADLLYYSEKKSYAYAAFCRLLHLLALSSESSAKEVTLMPTEKLRCCRYTEIALASTSIQNIDTTRKRTY